MDYQVNLGELVNFTQSFLAPGEAGREFTRFYNAKGEMYDLERLINPSDCELAQNLISTSFGIDKDDPYIGSLVGAYVTQGSLHINEVLQIVGGARHYFSFIQELVQSSIEHISQGISVIDHGLHMVAWNRRYEEFFEYPEGLVSAGRPVADLIRFNLENQGVEGDDLELEVHKRLAYLKEGKPHSFERERPDGRVLEVYGNPMPSGGFVTSYTDITSHKKLERQLREANENLEIRVQERTKELEAAKLDAEQANYSKSRFLAAASHDLMQPLNAAGLFASALSERATNPDIKELALNVSSSLQAADGLLNSLLEVSRLDAGTIKPKLEVFAIEDLLSALEKEFTVLAKEKSLDFRKVSSSQVVHSDQQLLRRIVQNFLSNAIKYTDTGRVVLGCRVREGVCRIEVWDNGPGIPDDKQAEIFQEFRRLQNDHERGEKGLGLGLSIADRLARLLNHPIQVRSWNNQQMEKGSVFAVDVPLADKSELLKPAATNTALMSNSLVGCRVLCVDNEVTVLEGMKALLSEWRCEVDIVSDLPSAIKVIEEQGIKPDIILADYQLDDGVTGLDVLNALNQGLEQAIPAIVITAHNTEDVRESATSQGYLFLPKPVKPAALRAVMTRLLK